MKCPTCQATNQPFASSCTECGTPLGKMCPDCNYVNQSEARYCGGCGKPLSGLQSAAYLLEPERRQSTILFCDLVGSTKSSTTRDLEDHRKILRAFHETCEAVIARHDGSITDYVGDGIEVLFGLSRVREDDAERAVRAGLELVTAVSCLAVLPGVQLHAHLGIATGLGIIGDRIGEGTAACKTTVIGPATNLANRLQAVAGPGEVVISDKTRELVGNLFQYEDLGFKSLKGFDKPMRAWKVLGERPGVSRFEAIRARAGFGPMVGREHELKMLAERWERAREGTGQIVTVIGEAGIGKSRLTQAFLETISPEPHGLLRLFSGPHFQNTALFPVTQQLEQLAQITSKDMPSEKLGKLKALLLRTSSQATGDGIFPYVAAALSIPPEAGYPAIRDIPEMQRQRTLNALKTFVQGLATQQKPLLVIFEDLHWADRTSLELLELIAAEIKSTPVLLLGTSRPDPNFSSPGGKQDYAVTVTLARLSQQDAAQIVTHVTHGESLSPETLKQILTKSDGVPLFVEELTKAVVETGGPSVEVPSSLEDSLMARLHLLRAGKEVALVASAIGREFPYDLLSKVHEASPVELQSALAQLTEADLIRPRGNPPDCSYVFKHALIQEKAYNSMLSEKRRPLHARIAKVLEAHGDTKESMPELLAHHLTEAGQLEKAFPYWKDAGVRAKTRAAFAEGRTHLTRALKLLDHVPEQTRRQVELDLRLQLGYCVQAAQGYADTEVADAYQRARELCSMLGDTTELYPVLRGLYVFYTVRCEFDAALELAEHCVRLGKETYKKDKKRPEYLIEGYDALGYVLFYQGDLQGAFKAFSEGIELYRAHDGHRLNYPFVPQDPAVAMLSALAIVSWLLGKTAKASQCAEEVLALVETLNRPFDRAYAHCFVAMLENIRRQPQRALEHAGKTVNIAQEYGFTIWLGAGTLHLAIAMGALGQSAQALAYLTQALAGWEGCGAKLNLSFFLAGLSETQRAGGDTGLALAAVEKAIVHATEHNEHFYDAALYRIRAELRAASGGTANQLAEKDFVRSHEIAQRQGAGMLELLTAMRWHRWALSSGGSSRSRGALRAAYAALSKAGATGQELQEAKELLAEPQKA